MGYLCPNPMQCISQKSDRMKGAKEKLKTEKEQ